METSKVTKPAQQEQTQPAQRLTLPADELKRLTDFFSILIQINQRVNVTKTYAKQIK